MVQSKNNRTPDFGKDIAIDISKTCTDLEKLYRYLDSFTKHKFRKETYLYMRCTLDNISVFQTILPLMDRFSVQQKITFLKHGTMMFYPHKLYVGYKFSTKTKMYVKLQEFDLVVGDE